MPWYCWQNIVSINFVCYIFSPAFVVSNFLLPNAWHALQVLSSSALFMVYFVVTADVRSRSVTVFTFNLFIFVLHCQLVWISHLFMPKFGIQPLHVHALEQINHKKDWRCSCPKKLISASSTTSWQLYILFCLLSCYSHLCTFVKPSRCWAALHLLKQWPDPCTSHTLWLDGHCSSRQ